MTKAELIKELEHYNDDEELFGLTSDKWVPHKILSFANKTETYANYRNYWSNYYENLLINCNLQINFCNKKLDEASNKLKIKETKKWRNIYEKQLSTVVHLKNNAEQFAACADIYSKMTDEECEAKIF